MAAIKKLACIYGEAWGSSDASYVGNHFDFLITDFPDQSADASPVKTYNPSIKIIGYRDLVYAKSSDPNWATINANESWFLHDNAGNRIESTGFAGFYLMDPTSGWKTNWITYVNQLLASYPKYDGVMADDCWYSLSAVTSWGTLKDAVTGVTLKTSDIPSGALSNWNANITSMLKYIKANLSSGKIIVPNSDESFAGSHAYIDVVDGTVTEGYIHAVFEDVSSHNYMLYGNFENSLAHLQYAVANNKIALCVTGCTTDDAATVLYCYAGFMLGMGPMAYWGWNTNAYQFGADNYQSIMATDIGTPTGACYQSQNVYMRDFTGGKILFNSTANTYTVNIGNGYTLNGVSVSSVTLGPYNAVVLVGSPAGGTFTFGRTTVGSLSTTFYTGIPRATQYTPAQSGTLTDIMLYLTNSGPGKHATVGVHADSGGYPGALLAVSTNDEITTDGWHDFTGFNVQVTAGVPVWLSNMSDSDLMWWYDNGGANYVQCASNSSAYPNFPNPFTAGQLTGNYNTSIYAIVSVTTPITPTYFVNLAIIPTSGNLPFTINFGGYLSRFNNTPDTGTIVNGEIIQVQALVPGGSTWVNTGINATTGPGTAGTGYFSGAYQLAEPTIYPGAWQFRAYYAGNPTKYLFGCQTTQKRDLRKVNALIL